ncbi:hypothetical protein L9F63_024302 [Diploptera punctata]|uniref:cystathionine gamma-lyase n=1 Tax=Diploptera punctata TaxID=6984 RepID=A0AAD7ZHE2_DIPPU|nr:hypothetical protein L9F63_024302 [Diploptera punctata]
MSEHKFDTKTVTLGYSPEKWNCYSVVPPIGMSTTFELEDPSTDKGYLYTRTSNPSRSQLETGIALLEDSRYALCYSSGICAIGAVVQMLSPGDHIVSDSIIYGGTYHYFNRIVPRSNITTTYIDTTNPSNVEKALKEHPNTKLVYLESPSNPLTTVCDISKIAQIVKKHEGVILAVDNTFLTPYFQKPLHLGAHVVAYSLTKYMNGHDDVCMGAVCCNDEEIYLKLKSLQNDTGLNPSPFECYLTFRGLKTLAIRMRQHMKNSIEVAKFLETHPKVVKVLHPWLPSHPQHEVAKKQASGHSGMVAFYVKGGLKEVSDLLKKFKLIGMAASLGGVHSVAEIPTVLSHASVPEDMKEQLGITNNLVRLSVGIEDAEDIIEDLNQALSVIVSFS